MNAPGRNGRIFTCDMGANTLETQRSVVLHGIKYLVCAVHLAFRVLFFFFFPPQTYGVNTFLTHRWVVMVNGVEVKEWLVSERQEKQSFVLSKADL